MKHIITILLAAICLSSFGQDTTSFSKTSTQVYSQDTAFFTKAPEKSKSTVKKADDGYKVVVPKASEYADYKVIEPKKYVQIAQSSDSVYYEQNSIQYYQNTSAKQDKPVYLEDKLKQLQYAQDNTPLTYTSMKYLQSLPYLK